jgi:flagellar biosynthesis protein FliR
MPASLTLPLGLLFGFLLVLARVGGALVFVPLPGAAGALAPARVVLAMGFTLSLVSRWPVLSGPPPGVGVLLCWLAAESSLGLAIGVAVAILLEAFTLAAQVMGLQAGYAYASTIDPNTQADSGILLVFAQLMAGILFFAIGLDRQVLRLFADTLERIPPGRFVPGAANAEALVRLGANLFTFGVRLALPLVGLLVMVDVALALVGRLNAQLQLLSLAFPVKMLTALVVLGWIAGLIPRLMLQLAGVVWGALPRVLGG